MLLMMLSATISAQRLTVTGTVTGSDTGEPLIGVTVMDLTTKEGVVTDLDGNYRITVNKGANLQFSYVGYENKTLKATEININVELKLKDEMLDELVVVGYGSVKKSDLTGAVASVGGDQLTKTPAPSLANALQGKVAGVTVNSLSGRPGAGAEVRVRGVGTINGASPIYVVDGVICDDISFLAPNDIDQVEVLKDASAAAIYGARGANGVIIVTTNTGARNKRAQVSFNGYFGFQQRWRKLDVMNAKDFADTYVAINGNTSAKKVYNEQGFNKWLSVYQGLKNSDYYPTIYDPETNPDGVDYSQINTDWQDEVFRTGLIQNYHLAVDGSGDKFTYSASGSWFKQDGIIIGSDFRRFTARLNTTYQAFPWLKLGENLSFVSTTAKNAYESGDNSESAGASILSAAFAMAPWDPTHYPEGSVNRKGKDLSGQVSAASNFKNVTNPFSMVEYSHPKTTSQRFLGNLFLELTPIKHFVWRTNYSFDYRITQDRSFMESYEFSSYDQRETNFLSRGLAKAFYYNVDNILTYNNQFGKHSLTAMAGFTVEELNTYSIGGSGSTILNPVQKNWYLSQTTDDFGRPGDGASRTRRQSWLGRVNYSFDERYLLTVNFRADGSSKFKENRWGYFPSFALAWRIDQESFMKNANAVSALKLRLGWGRVGNDNIGNDAFVLNMFSNGPTFVDYVFGKDQALANGAAVLTWVNNGGHWENTEQYSLGVDFSFWNGKLSGSLDGFIRDTNDMLMGVNAPAHVGNRYAGMANVGKVRNQGIELSLEHRMAVTKDFSYSIGGNISYIDNKLVSLNGGSPIYTSYNQVQVVDKGFPLYYFWGYQYDGIFRTDEEVFERLPGYNSTDTPFHAGDAIYRDNNGDGRIDDNDRVYLGSCIPKISYGINLGLWYRDFDLTIFFQGVGGSKIYNQMRHRLESNGATSVIAPEMKDAWTVDNPDGSIPNPRNSVNYYVSDRFLEKADYFRLKDLQLGYSLPKSVLGKKGLSKCRFYVQCSNVFTVTKYKGFDPEVNGGVDYGNYPQSRTFLFGVNITY